MRLIDADALLQSTDEESVHAWEIALAPTVDAVKHGHWYFKPLWKGADAKYCECSFCKKPSWWVSDYCPNCGAKMDEVKDEID